MYGGIALLKPLGDRVIVKVVEDEEETVGGIVLANNAKQKPQQGKIVAVGDTILYDKYAGSEVKYEGDDYLVLHEKDIMAIVE